MSPVLVIVAAESYSGTEHLSINGSMRMFEMTVSHTRNLHSGGTDERAGHGDEIPKKLHPGGGPRLVPALYDLTAKLLGADQARRALLDQAPLRTSHRVLDVGCGTGSLATLLKRLYPEVEVVGLDPDPKALTRARRKAERAGVPVQFDQGFSDELEYGTASFDLAFASFMFHHLQGDEKEKTLREIRRVLKPGGRLYLLDFEVRKSASDHWFSCLLHSHERLRDNSESRILALMTQAGFTDAKKVRHRAVLFGLGHAGYYQASVPSSEASARPSSLK